MIVLVCCEDVRRQVDTLIFHNFIRRRRKYLFSRDLQAPMNFIFLFIFTACEGVMLGAVTAHVRTDAVAVYNIPLPHNDLS